MTIVRIVGIIAALAGAADAAPAITAPAGWTLDPQLSARLSAPRRSGLVSASMQAYRPAAPGAVLYTTRLELKPAAERRDAVATAELDELRGAMQRQGANAKQESSAQRADPDGKLLEGSLTWRDAAAGVRDASRTVVAADATKLVAVTGQCVLGGEATPELAKACEAALATLDVGIAVDQRVALAIIADASAAAAPVPEPASASGPSPSRAAPATMGDGSRVQPMPTGPRAKPEPRIDTETDRRPVYFGLGLVLLAAMFWWNRKRRERFEADDDRAQPRRPATAEPERSADDDADDLHAAADHKPVKEKPE